MRFDHGLLTAGVCALSLLAAPGSALAADDDAKELETYEVGARRPAEVPKAKLERPEFDAPRISLDSLKKSDGLSDIKLNPLVPPSGNAPAVRQGEVQPAPLSTPPPDYPRQAAIDGTEGYVVVEYTINTRGGTEDIVILESSPKDVFDREARRAVSRWTFTPYQVDGVAQPKRIRQTIAFDLGG